MTLANELHALRERLRVSLDQVQKVIDLTVHPARGGNLNSNAKPTGGVETSLLRPKL